LAVDLRSRLWRLAARHGVENLIERVGRQVLIIIGVDLRHRRVDAGAEAFNLDPGELAVGGHFHLLADALAATELVLAREQHLSQLDGLAAAAAHELGTPLSTISVIAKELENAIRADAPHGDDVRLLREQATRCRDILGKLTELSSGGEPFDRMPLTSLIEEVVAPHRNFGVAIDVALPPERGGEPVAARNPAILYGLGNLLENAVDFAHERVEVGASWNQDALEVTITDDGPGFAPEIMARIGEPYVTSRRRNQREDDELPTGLGLGFFIAKTLLERSGATLSFENRAAPGRGAIVHMRWNREDFERPLTFAAA